MLGRPCRSHIAPDSAPLPRDPRIDVLWVPRKYGPYIVPNSSQHAACGSAVWGSSCPPPPSVAMASALAPGDDRESAGDVAGDGCAEDEEDPEALGISGGGLLRGV